MFDSAAVHQCIDRVKSHTREYSGRAKIYARYFWMLLVEKGYLWVSLLFYCENLFRFELFRHPDALLQRGVRVEQELYPRLGVDLG